MERRLMLVTVSSLQLAAGVAGQVVAVRDGRAFDIALLTWQGRPERVARDSWLLGTGLSAPIALQVTQAMATARLARGPSTPAALILGGMGAAMSAGYLVEREFRDAVTPGGSDRVVTLIAVSGFTLAVAMAALGLRRPPLPDSG